MANEELTAIFQDHPKTNLIGQIPIHDIPRLALDNKKFDHLLSGNITPYAATKPPIIISNWKKFIITLKTFLMKISIHILLQPNNHRIFCFITGHTNHFTRFQINE